MLNRSAVDYDGIDCNEDDCDVCPHVACVRLGMCEYCMCPEQCNKYTPQFDVAGIFRFV